MNAQINYVGQDKRMGKGGRGEKEERKEEGEK
jgi:hypothetical protein